jgi:hypothetical protein
MKIELKNVKINKMFSEETTCFTADVFINGKKTAYAKNDGRGGNTNIQPYVGMSLDEAYNYCKTLPKEFGYPQTLDSVIDDILFEKEKEKEQKKIEKLCLTNIVWGKEGGMSYTKIGFKGNPKLEDLKKTTVGKNALKSLIEKVKKEYMKEGEVLFNNNLAI